MAAVRLDRMAGRHEAVAMSPVERIDLDPADLWRLEGLAWEQMAAELGVGVNTVRRRAKAHGFVKQGTYNGDTPASYEEGPCLGCGVSWPRVWIDDDYRCPECPAHLDPPPSYVEGRWGEVPTTDEGWMALELEAWKQRRKTDRDRMARPYTRLPPSYGGSVPSQGGMLR